LPLEVFAGVLGTATLIGFLLLWLFQPSSRLAHLGWLTIIVLYFSASATALVRNW
jgi:hypothetical protein